MSSLVLQKLLSNLISLFSAVKIKDYFLLVFCVSLWSVRISAPCLILRAPGWRALTPQHLRRWGGGEGGSAACWFSELPEAIGVTFTTISLQIKSHHHAFLASVEWRGAGLLWVQKRRTWKCGKEHWWTTGPPGSSEVCSGPPGVHSEQILTLGIWCR